MLLERRKKFYTTLKLPGDTLGNDFTRLTEYKSKDASKKWPRFEHVIDLLNGALELQRSKGVTVQEEVPYDVSDDLDENLEE